VPVNSDVSRLIETRSPQVPVTSAPKSEQKTKHLALQILQIVVWPLAIIIAMLIYRETSSLKDIKLDAKGLKISFFLLQAAERGGPSSKRPEAPPDTKAIQEIARKSSGLTLTGSKILWVDDNPEGQLYERNALEALGVQFSLAKTTSEAVPLLRSQQFQLVITDFKRADDDRGGYTLLEEVKKIQPKTPVIIYSASVTPKLEAEAKERGAFAETDQPQRLFSLAIEALVAK